VGFVSLVTRVLLFCFFSFFLLFFFVVVIFSGRCSRTCGGGFRTRHRNIVRASAYGGVACPQLGDIQACSEHICPVNCVVSAFGEWTACAKTCIPNGGAAGKQTRARKTVTPASYGGKACPSATETRECVDTPCPTDCQLSAYGAWGACSRTCGSGYKASQRKIIVRNAYGGRPSAGLSAACFCARAFVCDGATGGSECNLFLFLCSVVLLFCQEHLVVCCGRPKRATPTAAQSTAKWRHGVTGYLARGLAELARRRDTAACSSQRRTAATAAQR
jgi:hypothetical protein